MQNHVIEMRNSTLAERILLKRVLEDNKETVYLSRCNVNGIMVDTLWELERELVWTKLAFSNEKWQNVNDTFTPTITLKEFIDKYKTL